MKKSIITTVAAIMVMACQNQPPAMKHYTVTYTNGDVENVTAFDYIYSDDGCVSFNARTFNAPTIYRCGIRKVIQK